MSEVELEAVPCKLRKQILLALSDPEFSESIKGLTCGLSLGVLNSGGREVSASIPVLAGHADGEKLSVNAPAAVWRDIMSAQPPVGLHSVTAGLRSGALTMVGNAVSAAQALHSLERLFEILRGQMQEDDPGFCSLQPIRGSYATLTIPKNEPFQVYVEESGSAAAPTILMLHTAGADGRQFHALMADKTMMRDWHMIVFDMPGHGRSMPRPCHAWRPYVLNQAGYLAICRAFIEQHVQKSVVLMGCSMGAAIALKLAKESPEDVSAVIALEAPWKATGRRSAMLSDARVNQVAHNAAYVRGLMSPSSPLARRRSAAWIYGQGGFQIYSGDLAFYSDDFDAEADLAGLNGERKVISLLTGAYDYSASPADTTKVAAIIPGSRLTIMQDLGHFPMIENPCRLLEYLRPELDIIKQRMTQDA